MILFRWHTVHGCSEWIRLRVARYVGPEVHGLPSLGPCTRAALAGAPFLAIPGAVPLPAYAAPPLEVAPYAGGWLAAPQFELPGGWSAGGSVPFPPSFAGPGPGEVLPALPPTSLALLPPAEQETPPGVAPPSGSGAMPREASPTPGAGTLTPPGITQPPPENVPEPSSAALVAGALGAAAVLRKRHASGPSAAWPVARGRHSGSNPQPGAGPFAARASPAPGGLV